MSCIRFNTPEQRRLMRETAPTMPTPEEAASRHPVPAMTESKLRRLSLLARDADPKIRESVASSLHAPVEVHRALAVDPDTGVRGCLARNEATPIDVLRSLAADRAESVRGWLAVNVRTPADVVQLLSADESETVRRLVHWRSGTVVPASTV